MIYIIADDLTGANDTGAQFAKKGYLTTVLILEDKLPEKFCTENYDVVVMDTETRSVDEKSARNRLNKILEELSISKKDVIYKKIDSTLRGNVGAEIEEIMKIFGKKVCLFSPSYPSLYRFTLGGFILVQKNSTALSRYSGSLFIKQKDTFIPSILKKQTNLPIKRIDILDVSKGKEAILNKLNTLIKGEKQIIVIDSVNNKNLQDIVSCGLSYGDSVLFSGSAGLANYLAECPKNGNSNAEHKNRKSPILIMGGSQNPIMIGQINFLRSNMDLNELKFDIRQIITRKNQYLNYCRNECFKILKNNKDLVIYTDAKDNEKRLINKELIQEYKISYTEIGEKIKEAFGMLAASLVKGGNIRNLILTGGDIALSVCKRLNITQLRVLDELLPGIPLTRAYYKKQNLNIVTKAGGFGQEDTLYKIINKLYYFQDVFTHCRSFL